MYSKETLAVVTILSSILYLGACGGESTDGGGDHTEGKAAFTKYCTLCHGEDGKRQLNGAKDITVSLMPLEDRVTLIKSGKNLMAPYGGILTPEEIEAVAKYTMVLK